MPRLPHPPEYYRKLHEAHHRAATGLFIASGKKLLHEALRSLPVERFHAIMYDTERRLPPLPPELRERSYRLPAWQIARISGQDTPDGIVTILHCPPPPSFPPFPSALLIENLQDPGNLGTLIRTAEWLGIQHIWLTSNSVDPFHPKVVRGSMGSLFRTHIQRVGSWERLLSGYEGRCVVAAADGVPVHAVDWRQYDALYIGSEAHGVRRAPTHWLRVAIPPSATSQAESLNAAIAAAILLYLQREVRAGRLHTSPLL